MCVCVWSKVKWVSQSCPTHCKPMDYSPLPGSSVHGDSPGKYTGLGAILEWFAIHFSRGSSQPRDETLVSHIAGGLFINWAIGKPKNTGVGSLSLIWSRNGTRVSYIAGRFFTNWATGEAHILLSIKENKMQPFATMCMDLENITLSEKSQKKTITVLNHSMWNLKK